MVSAAGGSVTAYGDVRAGERGSRVRRVGRIVLECDCGERLILIGPMAVRRSGRVLECLCRERFTLAGRVVDHDVTGHLGVQSPEDKHGYSWLEDCLEWLEGKEARQEYYARLEQATSW